ncbi:class I SAM-dependent methyltransferase [Streptomyces sp. NPDC026206]|uniref:class I SAM-dependent methyltransferase n=1 Tax=Streptomyces sp. NPDC026206 TaxID=3157089 RepID=UPI0033F467C4
MELSSTHVPPARPAPFSPAEMELHLNRLRRVAPGLHACVDTGRARDWARDATARAAFAADDFGDEHAGGRGTSYVRAQAHNLTARAEGIRRLLALIRGDRAPARTTVVDVLGGDGLVRRVAGRLGMTDVAVLTCDASPYMVRAAWSARCPALLQRADRLLQHDGSVDGVLVAYGSHHIAPRDRAELAREAHRVLRPGGVMVLHDFLVGSPMDTWFGEVVDRYSRTGHTFEHFTREDIGNYLTKAGFEPVEVISMNDPYTAGAATPEAAEIDLGHYLLDMYGLTGIEDIHGPEAARRTIGLAKGIFREVGADGTVHGFSMRYDMSSKVWKCTVPRTAVVGIGRKPV